MFQSDSGRTAHTRPLRCSSVALGTSKAKAPTKGLSKFNSMAFGLEVYASQYGSTRHHARLASSRWSGVTARAFHPQGSYERFQSCILTSHPPSPSFAWHNEVDRGRKRGLLIPRKRPGNDRRLKRIASGVVATSRCAVGSSSTLRESGFRRRKSW